ncbi:hypothetical protein [Streptomyces sp. NPDC053048]|uniref:hypothetical protein n=1 Tax=Streptomyces sp. NPDC053048 TaxID=3365694 RepID=UPI0037D1B9E3
MDDDSAFQDLIKGLEWQIHADRYQTLGALAVLAARLSGAVYTEAVLAGVPASLAQEMATDSWVAMLGEDGTQPADADTPEGTS